MNFPGYNARGQNKPTMQTTAEPQAVETFEDVQLATIRMKWTGLRPLIMNNPRSVDPFDVYTQQRKALTAKRGKDMTDDNLRELDLISWRAGVYWDDQDGFVIPSANLERAILTPEERRKMEANLEHASMRLILMSRAKSFANLAKQHEPKLLEKKATR